MLKAVIYTSRHQMAHGMSLTKKSTGRFCCLLTFILSSLFHIFLWKKCSYTSIPMLIFNKEIGVDL